MTALRKPASAPAEKLLQLLTGGAQETVYGIDHTVHGMQDNGTYYVNVRILHPGSTSTGRAR